MLSFSREATSETYGPRVFFLIYLLCDLFFCTFYSDLLNQKYKNTLLHFILFTIYLFNLLQLSPVHAPLEAPYPKGIDNPFNTSGCEVLLFVCRGWLRCVAWFTYWFDNLGFISEGNASVAVLHHPFLFGEIPT